eukprot:4775489-Amphidinium_carterae.1
MPKTDARDPHDRPVHVKSVSSVAIAVDTCVRTHPYKTFCRVPSAKKLGIVATRNNKTHKAKTRQCCGAVAYKDVHSAPNHEQRLINALG